MVGGISVCVTFGVGGMMVGGIILCVTFGVGGMMVDGIILCGTFGVGLSDLFSYISLYESLLQP